MCGIAVVYRYRPERSPVDVASLLRIRDYMAPRGPDGRGLRLSRDERIGLAHRRLSIIDLSERGAQPMSTSDDRYTVVFNGEIYNYRALRRDLEARGHCFRSDSDTEVLLHLYADRGEAMVRDLRGMFAFALWDDERKRLFLARDPFGIKPLYYSDDGRCFRAASEVKALLAGGRIDISPEPAGHVGFFLWGHVPEPYTLYRGIRAIPAGSTLSIGEDGRAEIRRYADVAELLAQAETAPVPRDVEEAHEVLRSALVDTVRHHLVADVEVGVFLSAGLDSTTLAAIATAVSGRLRTVTLAFDEFTGTPADEAPLAELTARRLGTDHVTVRITRDDFRRELPRLMDRMDQPTLDGVNSYFVSLAAAERGLKVALSGLGGDELFGGYPSFRDVPRLVAALRPLPASGALGRGFRMVSAPILRRVTSPKYASVLEYGREFGGAYLLRRGLFMPWELPAFLDADLVRAGWRELAPALSTPPGIEGIDSSRLKVAALETTLYMRNQLLRDTDWASMSHSLEVRVPLVDWVLWQSVAPIVHQSAWLDKKALVMGLRVPLPEDAFARPKTGFTTPTREWAAAELNGGASGRGLRGWARDVYQHTTQQAA